MNKISALFVIALGLLSGCAAISPRVSSVSPPVKRAATHAGFTAEAFFVLEFEHDQKGNLVQAASYGPTDSMFKCLQDQAMKKARAQGYNPAGFSSQFTCQHVEFRGPIVHGAVVMQPYARNQPPPNAWVLFATDFSAHGKYLGAEMLHGVTLPSTCKRQARDIIDSNTSAIPSGASVLIYCIPVPPLPTDTTLPNGDSVL